MKENVLVILLLVIAMTIPVVVNGEAIAKLEPTIMVFLAGFAGFIVLAIYLPMFTMYNLM